MGRLSGFIASILIGLVLGLAFGWLVAPFHPRGAPLDDLRADYRLDYLLMIAEAYQADGDAAAAAQRIARLGSQPPVELAARGYQLAVQAGYAPEDLRRLEDLIRGVASPLDPTAAPAALLTPQVTP